MKKIINFIEVMFYIAVIVVIMIIAFALFRPSDYEAKTTHRFFVVMTDSMSPKIEPMSLIIVDRRKPDVYEIDDIITFSTFVKDDEFKSIITHRVAEVIDNNGNISYRTKPEAEGLIDRWIITNDDIIGKVIYIIPYIGILVLGAQRMMFPIIIIANLIIYALLIQHIVRWKYLN